MTDRLSDERLRNLEIYDWLSGVVDNDAAPNPRAAAGALERLSSLRAENEQLRKRCTWLQERRAVLRKLLSAKWSKRKEVRRMRAKLAAGPVMPEVPSESVQIVIIDTVNNAIAGRGNWSCYGLYVDIRTALLKEQSR